MKRIGMLLLSASINEQEKEKLLPTGVSIHYTRLPVKRPTYEAMLHMADHVEEAASLLADAKVDIIAFSCTAGSFIKGAGYDQEIIDRITRATGLPATTMTTAVVASLKALGIRKLVLITPYVEQMNKIEKAVLESAGFQVLAYRGLGLDNVSKQYEAEPLRWYDLVKEMKHPEADGYFVSCGGIRAVDIIEQAEKAVGKPVVTSYQTLVWHCLRKIGLQEPVEGFGRLLRIPFRGFGGRLSPS